MFVTLLILWNVSFHWNERKRKAVNSTINWTSVTLCEFVNDIGRLPGMRYDISTNKIRRKAVCICIETMSSPIPQIKAFWRTMGADWYTCVQWCRVEVRRGQCPGPGSAVRDRAKQDLFSTRKTSFVVIWRALPSVNVRLAVFVGQVSMPPLLQ